MKTRSVLIGIVLLGWAACAQAGVYNALDDFSLTNNPNGAWSYGLFNVSTQAFQAFTTMDTDWNGMSAWSNGSVDTGPAVVYNNTTDPVAVYENGGAWGPWTVPAGTLAIDGFGQVGSDYVGIRWTAPSAGTVDASALFSHLELVGWMENCFVNVKGTDVVGLAVNPADLNWSQSGISVVAGDTITFWGGGQGMAGFDATISLVPEPASMVCLATGLIGLLCYAWRKRK